MLKDGQGVIEVDDDFGFIIQIEVADGGRAEEAVGGEGVGVPISGAVAVIGIHAEGVGSDDFGSGLAVEVGNGRAANMLEAVKDVVGNIPEDGIAVTGVLSIAANE